MNKDAENKMSSFIKSKVKVQNVVMYYQLVNTFKQLKISKALLRYIDCSFTTICKTNNFLELDFSSVSKILASSELNITSELEVYHAADTWLGYNLEKRSKFAECILTKVRLPLLSEDVLKGLLGFNRVLRKSSSFHKNEKCLDVINRILENKKVFYRNKNAAHQTHRYCSHEMFNFLIFQKTSRAVSQINRSNFNKIKTVKKLEHDFLSYGTVLVNGALYRFERLSKFKLSVKQYSAGAKKWKIFTDSHICYRNFRLCVFMDNIYVIGGYDKNKRRLVSACFVLDTSNRKWSKIQSMQAERQGLACTVFRGNVVVTGGSDLFNLRSSVESYNHVSDTWSYMPSLVTPRYQHGAVAVKNKLIVIGGLGQQGFLRSCEVYDANSNAFSLLKEPPSCIKYNLINAYGSRTVSVGNKVIIFGNISNFVTFYDVDKDEWSEEYIRVIKYLNVFTSLKLPQMVDFN